MNNGNIDDNQGHTGLPCSTEGEPCLWKSKVLVPVALNYCEVLLCLVSSNTLNLKVNDHMHKVL